MAKVTFKRGPDIGAIPVKDGQLVYDTNTGETYTDLETGRIQTGYVIDDSKIDDKTANSSKKIIENLCPPFSKTAPVVTCNPVVGYPLSVKSHLIPRQSGSGDPSPENVRPFVPYERAEMTRCGSNLLDSSKTIDTYGSDVEISGDRIRITINQNKVNSFAAFMLSKNCPPGKYNVNAKAKIINSKNSLKAWIRIFYGREDTVAIGIKGETSLNFTVKPGQNQNVKVYLYAYNASPTDQIGDIIEYSEVSVTPEYGDKPYTPYTGSTYTAPLPAETYGGEVDWRGKTFGDGWDKVAFDGSADELWRYDPFNEHDRFLIRLDKPIAVYGTDPKQQPLRCNLAKSATPNYNNHAIWVPSGTIDLVVSFDGTKTVEALREMLKISPMEIAYLTTTPPRSEALTPSSTPTAIPGTNTLYSVGGDTTVEGRENPIATIEALTQRVADLENHAEPLPQPTAE